MSLGSNLGNRRENIERALLLLGRCAGKVEACSPLVETEPWGFSSPHPFLNAAARLTTALEPLPLLDVTQHIERLLGRKRKSSGGIYHDRPIDIDILLYFHEGRPLTLSHPRLCLPHPQMHLRRFVLQPLSLIAPGLEHPVLHRTVARLLSEVQ